MPLAQLQLHIRRANEDDAALLAQLNADVQRLHAALEPDVFRADTDLVVVAAFFAAWLIKPSHTLVVAEADGEPCGYAWIERQERAGTPFSYAMTRCFVHHVAVRPTARRRGIATALVRHAEAEAAAAGIHELALDVWATNAAAQGFFTALGFTPQRWAMAKRLP